MIDYDERYKDYPSRIEGILLEGFGAMGDTPTISGGAIISGKVITDPPAPFPQIPTVEGTTIIDYNGTPKPEKVELTYRKPKGQ